MLKKIAYVIAVLMFAFGFLLIGCNGPLRPAPPSPYGPPAPAPAPAEIPAQLLDAHNRERAARGKAPLVLNPQLQAAAAAHADHMAKVRRMAHFGIGDGDPRTRIQATGYRYLNASENVAWNQRDVATVMKDWMASPGHRANVLGNYTQCGLAVAYGPNKDPYWCACFATPGGARVMAASPANYTVTATKTTSSIATSIP